MEDGERRRKHWRLWLTVTWYAGVGFGVGTSERHGSQCDNQSVIWRPSALVYVRVLDTRMSGRGVLSLPGAGGADDCRPPEAGHCRLRARSTRGHIEPDTGERTLSRLGVGQKRLTTGRHHIRPHHIRTQLTVHAPRARELLRVRCRHYRTQHRVRVAADAPVLIRYRCSERRCERGEQGQWALDSVPGACVRASCSRPPQATACVQSKKSQETK